jgi:acetoin utilization deacetylase AcuC-like enzyme
MCAGNPGIFTLSVHAANNFPARKQSSSLDVALPDGVGDDAYLDTVAQVSCVSVCGVQGWCATARAGAAPAVGPAKSRQSQA